MAIALSCPSCDHELKVKDDLAGRKVRCPKCKAVISVLEKEEEEETRVTAKSSRRAAVEEEDSEDEERPRKKKKKKTKSKRGVLIGSVIGGLVLILIVALILIFGGGGNAKDNKVAKVEPAPVEPEPPPEPKIEPKESTGYIIRSMERTEIENALRQFGIAYKNFEILHNRGPKDQKELSPYYENNGRMNQFLTNKWIVFIWGVPRSDGGFPDGYSNTILAYEGIKDQHNNRFVLYGDGSVHTLDEPTFQQKPKAKGKEK